jgi:hypothetical protein
MEVLQKTTMEMAKKPKRFFAQSLDSIHVFFIKRRTLRKVLKTCMG